MKIAVVGAGLMGSGIALTCAQSGYDVLNIDTFPNAIEKAKANLKNLFDKKIAKGKINTDEAQETLNRIKYSDSYSVLNDYDLVIEAVPEKIEIKKSSFCGIR